MISYYDRKSINYYRLSMFNNRYLLDLIIAYLCSCCFEERSWCKIIGRIILKFGGMIMIFESIESLVQNLMMIAGVALFIALLVCILTFWVRMLIDCINRDFPKENDKIVWILVILFGNWLGAILYYFCVKNKK